MPQIGLITTGHGPRDEYVQYHRHLLGSLGQTVEIRIEHLLDGLSWPEIAPHTGGPEEVVLGAYVRAEGAVGPRMPNGTVHGYLRMDWAVTRVQAAVDRLVAGGADVIIFCAAAPLPVEGIRSPVPLLQPADVMANIVRDMAGHASSRLRVGLLTTAGHGRKDLEHWQGLSFASRLDLDNVVFEGDPLSAVPSLRGRKDVIVVWSYGWGLISPSPRPLSEMMEEMVGCPVLMGHRVTALMAAAILRCGFDDRRFAA
ncbi:AroM family protein [Roseomonas sp. OT10]|uniref:AroM family protein n=1 Tax=Roseomonas cutis TaxID=2897332 RepID=UPI001E46B3AA|nr:AroM family protein [Roseomonas sp. OT10]UFN48500.1 AroM family protein [Roseomonas sp. OT10]